MYSLSFFFSDNWCWLLWFHLLDRTFTVPSHLTKLDNLGPQKKIRHLFSQRAYSNITPYEIIAKMCNKEKESKTPLTCTVSWLRDPICFSSFWTFLPVAEGSALLSLWTLFSINLVCIWLICFVAAFCESTCWFRVIIGNENFWHLIKCIYIQILENSKLAKILKKKKGIERKPTTGRYRKKYSSWQDPDPFSSVGQDQLKLVSLLCTLWKLPLQITCLLKTAFFTENCHILKRHMNSLLTFAGNGSRISF